MPSRAGSQSGGSTPPYNHAGRRADDGARTPVPTRKPAWMLGLGRKDSNPRSRDQTGHPYVSSVTNRAVEPRPGSLGPARAGQIAPTDAPSAQIAVIDRPENPYERGM